MNENEIIEICKKYNINKYVIRKDMSIDVMEDVKLNNLDLTRLPLKFNEVHGDFDCSINRLVTLYGSPKVVVGKFDFSANDITSLMHSPNEVHGNFDCSFNSLSSFKHSPMLITGNLYCHSNPIKSLKGCPIIGGNFVCYIHDKLNYNKYKKKELRKSKIKHLKNLCK